MSRDARPSPEADWSAECSRMGIRLAAVKFGVGVFAARAFADGETIGVIRGRVVDDPEYESPHGIELAEGRSLEPEGPLRELNHCCEPNCWLSADADAGTSALHAARAIAEGEELTIDYGWPANDRPTVCACSSESCRLWIVGEGETCRWPYLLAHTRWDELPAWLEEKLRKRFR